MSRVGGGRYYDDRESDYYSNVGRGERVREYEEVDSRSRRRPERERERVVEQERIVIDERVRPRERDLGPDILREDYGRTTSGPMVLRTREEFDYRPRDLPREEIIAPPEPRREIIEERIEREEIVRRPERERERDWDREEVIVRRGGGERDRFGVDFDDTRSRGGRGSDSREEIDIRRVESNVSRGPRGYERDTREEDVIIRQDTRERPREVERGFEREEVIIRRGGEAERPREPDRGFEREEVIIRRGGETERPREPDRGFEREEVIIRRGGETERPREIDRGFERDRGGFEREEVIIRRGETERPREIERDTFERDDITIRRNGGRGYEHERDQFVRSRPVSRERSRGDERDREEIIIRKDEVDRGRGRGDASREEIIIRRDKERSVSPTTTIAPFEPPIVRAPPIHQEIITHHRHIDHGYEVIQPPMMTPIRTRTPQPPPAPIPPPRREEVSESIEINRHGERDGRAYDEDIAINISRESAGPTRGDELALRPREPIPDYGRGMELQRPHAGGEDVIGRRYEGVQDPRDRLWTEITKDLVSKAALDKAGYEYEETELFYYVFAYMNYDDVSRLVDLTTDLRISRRSRIEQLEWEQRDPRLRLEAIPAVPERERLMLGPPPRGAWEEETILRERDVSYDRRPLLQEEVVREREVVYDRRPIVQDEVFREREIGYDRRGPPGPPSRYY